jgi:hypothetical protein
VKKHFENGQSSIPGHRDEVGRVTVGIAYIGLLDIDKLLQKNSRMVAHLLRYSVRPDVLKSELETLFSGRIQLGSWEQYITPMFLV